MVLKGGAGGSRRADIDGRRNLGRGRRTGWAGQEMIRRAGTWQRNRVGTERRGEDTSEGGGDRSISFTSAPESRAMERLYHQCDRRPRTLMHETPQKTTSTSGEGERSGCRAPTRSCSMRSGVPRRTTPIRSLQRCCVVTGARAPKGWKVRRTLLAKMVGAGPQSSLASATIGSDTQPGQKHCLFHTSVFEQQ